MFEKVERSPKKAKNKDRRNNQETTKNDKAV
jgi:hypothetical protein